MPKATLFTILVFAASAGPVAALTLNLPASVVGEETRSEVPGSYALPTAPFDGKRVPARQVEGALDQRAFRLEAPGMTTLAILGPLRDQVAAAGFEIIFECDAPACGGFDFRFGTDVMPEPDMHVDLGDFRFLSAMRGEEAVSILVSRSANAAYVQITQVTASAVSEAPVTAVVDLDQAEDPQIGENTAPKATGIAAVLDETGAAVLEDLVFASGSASLSDGAYPSLAAVASWLQANPGATIALVGHTDASGSLAANVALSERRAEAVAKVLIETYGADRNRIEAEGVGYLAPRATNQTDEGRQKNRRVEVIVTSTH